MKKTFIVANWKSNHTQESATAWMHEMKKSLPQLPPEIQIIICPPFTLLPVCQTLTTSLALPFAIGAQDVSPFGQGAYTGAVNAAQIKDFASYVLIGHSERQKYFSENVGQIKQKIEQAVAQNLSILFFVQDEQALIPDGVTALVFEPPSAISPGKPIVPEIANTVAQKYKSHYQTVLYGGSVSTENVKSYLQMDAIDGLVIGKDSLDATTFINLIAYATT